MKNKKNERISELQNYMIFILGRAFEEESSNYVNEMAVLISKRLKDKYQNKYKRFGDFGKLAKREGLDKVSVGLSDVKIFLSDFWKSISQVYTYKNKNTAKASTSRSLKKLKENNYVVTEKLGGEIKIGLTQKGYVYYKKLWKELIPYFDIYEELKSGNIWRTKLKSELN